MPILVQSGAESVAFLLFYTGDKISGTISITSDPANVLYVKNEEGEFVETLPLKLTKETVFKFSVKTGVDFYFRFDDVNAGVMFSDVNLTVPAPFSFSYGRIQSPYFTFEIKNFQQQESSAVQLPDYTPRFNSFDASLSTIHVDLLILNISLIFVFLFSILRGLFRWR